MTLQAKVATGMKWQVFNIVGRQLISLVIFTLLARLLDPSAFGLVALVSVYLYFVTIFSSVGIGVALVLRKELEPAHIHTAFWCSAGLNLLMLVVTLAAAHPLSLLLGDARLVPLIRWLAFALMITSLSIVPARLLLKEMDFRRPALRTILATIAGGAVGVGMALSGYGVWSLVGQQLASAITGTIFLWLAARYVPRFVFSLPHLRELLKVGSVAYANAILSSLIARMDQFMVGRFGGAIPLGLYVVANRIPDVIRSATQQPMADVALPAFSSIQGDHGKMCRAITRGMELNSIVAFPLFVGLALVASDLVPFLFGEKWGGASILCSLMSIYALVSALQIFFYPALLAAGVNALYVIVNAATAVGVFTACAVGIHFGVIYVIVGLIINSLVFVIPNLMLLSRRIGLDAKSYYLPCVRPALAAILMSAAVLGIGAILPAGSSHFVRLVAGVAVGAVSYTAIMFAIQRKALMNLLQTAKHAALGKRTPAPSNPTE